MYVFFHRRTVARYDDQAIGRAMILMRMRSTMACGGEDADGCNHSRDENLIHDGLTLSVLFPLMPREICTGQPSRSILLSRANSLIGLVI